MKARYCQYCGNPLNDNCGCQKAHREEMQIAAHYGELDPEVSPNEHYSDLLYAARLER